MRIRQQIAKHLQPVFLAPLMPPLLFPRGA